MLAASPLARHVVGIADLGCRLYLDLRPLSLWLLALITQLLKSAGTPWSSLSRLQGSMEFYRLTVAVEIWFLLLAQE